MRYRLPHRASGPLAAACALLVVAVGRASAHGVTTRFDAPVPLGLVYLGGSLTVAASAVLVARLDVTPRPGVQVGSISPRVAETVRTAGRAGFLLGFVAVLLHGVVGARTASENFATLFTWSVWLKGVGIVAAIGGSPWPILSPWRTAYDAVCRLEGAEIGARSYPERLGRWPAFAGFVVLIGVIENLTRIPQRPAATAAVVAAYALVLFAGGLVFGRTWFDRADALAVLYGLLGRVAPVSVRRSDDGSAVVAVRSPWHGCHRAVDDRATAAFVVAVIYSVTFDGVAGSPAYRGISFGVRNLLPVDAAASLLLYLVGLVAFLAAFRSVVAVVVWVLESGRPPATAGDDTRPEPDGGVDGTVLLLAPTLVPILAGYEIAHNAAYVATSAGRLPRLVGLDAVDPLWWLSVPAFWGIQVVCIVGGHVVAVVAADVVTSRLAPTGRAATAAHAPHLVLMIGYTVVSLWVISLPVAP
jgi:hypothetical protein